MPTSAHAVLPGGFVAAARPSLAPRGPAQLVIKDSATGLRVRTIGLKAEPGAIVLGTASVADTGTTSGIAVLWKLANGQGLVQIRDAATGAWVRQMRFFGSAWQAGAMAAQDADLDGVSEIGVLAVKKDGTRAAIQLKDSETKQQIGWIPLPMD